jgi:hypothetical protein
MSFVYSSPNLRDRRVRVLVLHTKLYLNLVGRRGFYVPSEAWDFKGAYKPKAGIELIPCGSPRQLRFQSPPIIPIRRSETKNDIKNFVASGIRGEINLTSIITPGY